MREGHGAICGLRRFRPAMATTCCNGSFLARKQCGGRERGAFLASGCEPRFARFAVRTPPVRTNPQNPPTISVGGFSICDPPYNVNYANTPKDKLRGNHRPILNDNLGEDFGTFLQAACTNLLSVTKGAVYIAMSSSELDTLQQAFRNAGGKWSTFIIWAKNTFTLGRADYQRQYEPILYGWREGNDHYWCGARDQGDVWFVNKPAKNDLHPTMKPVELVERAIRNSSKTRDIVLDPFGGSGSTLIACEKSGRRARLIELDPKYIDVIIRRWQSFAGKKATRFADGLTFEEASSIEFREQIAGGHIGAVT